MPLLSVLRTTSGVTRQVGAAGAKGRQRVVERVGDEFLERSAMPPSPLRARCSLAPRRWTGDEQQEVCNLRAPNLIVGDVSIGVALGLLDQRGGLIRRRAQHDGVIAALAHLLIAVEAEDLGPR